MFSRFILPSSPRLAPNNAALNRLILDINAAHNSDQRASDPAPPTESSAVALRNRALRGDVRLPKELLEAVDNILAEADKPAIRTSALGLYSRLRQTSSILPPTTSYHSRQLLTPTYDAPTSLAYLSGLMPSIYASTLSVLTMARDRLALIGDWEPDRIIEYGSGTGSAAWAVEEVWGSETKKGEAIEYIGFEKERAMLDVSSGILGALTQRLLLKEKGSTLEPTRISAKAYQVEIPIPAQTLAKLHLSPSTYDPKTGKKTLALMAFTLGDETSKEKRRGLVKEMWESGAEVLVIIDRGTPGGSRLVVEAREQLLMLARRQQKEEREGLKGCFVVAPCPHDGACPLHDDPRSFCHFSQPLQAPSFLRHTKHSTSGVEHAKFSYLVIKRGSRPFSRPPPIDSLDDLFRRLAGGADDPTDGNPVSDHAAELNLPRVVAPIKKNPKHVTLEVCTNSGQIERHTIPKSQGKQSYYDARKASWGDAFPWAPKNGAQPVRPVPKGTIASLEKGEKVGKEKKGKKSVRRERDREDEVMEFEFGLEDLEKLKL